MHTFFKSTVLIISQEEVFNQTHLFYKITIKLYRYKNLNWILLKVSGLQIMKTP